MAHAKNKIIPKKARSQKIGSKVPHRVSMKLAMGPRQLPHRRFGHSSVVKMRTTFGIAGITGFPYGGPHDPNCETCVRMNANKAPFGKKNYQAATRPGQRIHSDIKVVPAALIGGHRYATCFVGCYSRKGKKDKKTYQKGGGNR